MSTLEFLGKIEKGFIRLPEGYEEYDNKYVRIIMLVEPSAQKSDKKERLRLVLKKMEHTKMFDNINNPVEWQKQLRNEWE